MNKKLIAIGVENERKMWEDHFGEAPYFDIYDMTGSRIETRINPYGEFGDQEKKHGDPQQIIQLLSDCSVFIGCSLGKVAKIREKGYEAVITTETDPLVALDAYLNTHALRELIK